MLGAGERGHEQLEADRKRERLVGLLAPERHELLGLRATREDVAVRDRAHRDVRNQRLPSPEGTRSPAGSSRSAASPPEGCGSRRGEVAVSSATSPPSASRRDPVAEHAGRKARRRHDEARTRDAFGEDVVDDRRERQVAEGAGTLPAVDPVPARLLDRPRLEVERLRLEPRDAREAVAGFPRASASAKCPWEHVHRVAGEPEGLEARACLAEGHGGSPYRRAVLRSTYLKRFAFHTDPGETSSQTTRCRRERMRKTILIALGSAVALVATAAAAAAVFTAGGVKCDHGDAGRRRRRSM